MADTYEKDLAQKSSLTLADYVRVVGSDNVSYKQLLSSFPAPFRTMSETDMPTLLKSLTQGTYFYRIDNVSGFPVTGGVVYRIVKTHAVNDARASIVAVPMNASSPDIYTAFVASASATSISWVKQPTRAEVDLIKKTSNLLRFNSISSASTQTIEQLGVGDTTYGSYVLFMRVDSAADGAWAGFVRHNAAGYQISEIYKGTHAQTPFVNTSGVVKTSSTTAINVHAYFLRLASWS